MPSTWWRRVERPTTAASRDPVAVTANARTMTDA